MKVTSLASLDMRFLRRTAWATVFTVMIAALCASAYYDSFWALRYAVTGLWAIGFFSLTALIFQNLLFDGQAIKGILYTFLKIASLGFIFAVNFYFWPVVDAEGNAIPGHTLALTLGLITPFVVFVLRLFGFLLEVQKNGGSLSLMDMMPKVPAAASKNSAGRIE